MDERKPEEVWTDEATGLLCLIRKGSLGSLCGYVGVSHGHPWAGKSYNDCTLPTAKPRGHRPGDGAPLTPGGVSMTERMIEGMAKRLICDDDRCGHTIETLVNVHGGLTFAGEWPEFGGPEIWWFGFDCAHSSDLVPKLGFRPPNATYKDPAFVERECIELARQLCAFKREGGSSDETV